MRTPGRRRLGLVSALGLVAVAPFLTGCPSQPACPSCRFRTASFSLTPDDLKGLTSAKMVTYIEHEDGECPEGSHCLTDRVDDVTCKVKGMRPGTYNQLLPERSGPGATHKISLEIVNLAGDDELDGNVGAPESNAPPRMPICLP